MFFHLPGLFDIIAPALSHAFWGFPHHYCFHTNRPLTRSPDTSATVTNAGGKGLRISMRDNPLNFAALPYTCHELEQATHMYELQPVHKTALSVSAAVMGVGRDNSWGTRPEAMFELPADKDYSLRFAIEPAL